MITDKQFMEDLERDYPNEDWDNVPNPDSFPDVYTVHGARWETNYMSGMRPPYWDTRKVYFSVEGEYKTREEAEEQVERCKTWEDIVPESLEIRAVKPREAVHKWLCKEWREDILAGKKVFPMYLP